MPGRLLAYLETLIFILVWPFAVRDLIKQAIHRIKQYRESLFGK